IVAISAGDSEGCAGDGAVAEHAREPRDEEMIRCGNDAPAEIAREGTVVGDGKNLRLGDPCITEGAAGCGGRWVNKDAFGFEDNEVLSEDRSIENRIGFSGKEGAAQSDGGSGRRRGWLLDRNRKHGNARLGSLLHFCDPETAL